MNIKITHNWLLEYLDTDATPGEIQKYLSLCGPSVEKVDPTSPTASLGVKKDYIYDIEITSNRVDMASVFGIAQECQAILPMFSKKARLKLNPLDLYRFSRIKSSGLTQIYDLKVSINNKNICSRFTAIVIDNVKIAPSPKYISERLTNCGIKSINNVIDISNYLMISLGQPVHVFDYDKITDKKMVMRLSKKGEVITTLDEKKITLPGGDIIIEDSKGRLIDLCGIMGGLNSAVDNNTKRVVLFVQTYNKALVRQTSMTTGQRTVAATYFEKGLDEERVEPTLVAGVELFEKLTGGKAASKLYDIYPEPYRKKTLDVRYKTLDSLIGVEIERGKIVEILKNLGFDQIGSPAERDRNDSIRIIIPSYRKNDVSIEEDIVEEVARIYGYHNLPLNLPPAANISRTEDLRKTFMVQNRIKYFLKHLGLNENINYSMISKKMLEDGGLRIEDHLKISNTISEEIVYMRTSLLPSLYKNISDNTGKPRHNTAPGEQESLKFFEISKVYLPRKNDLPQEIYRLGIGVNTNYYNLKGIVEALFAELNINEKIDYKIIDKDHAYFVEIDLDCLVKNYRLVPAYKPINPYAVIKLDKTFTLNAGTTYGVVCVAAQKSKLLEKIEVLSLYKNKLSLRFYYSSTERNITEKEAMGELTKLDL